MQGRITISYLVILLSVLVLMNTYPLLVSQDLVFRSKEKSMTASATTIHTAIAGLNQLTPENVANALSSVEVEGVSRIVITDCDSRILYDTMDIDENIGRTVTYRELTDALNGNLSVYIAYQNGAFYSCAAQPVLHRNRIIGGIYVYEHDTRQAALLQNLRFNLMRISLFAAALVLVFIICFERALARRLRALKSAIRGMREGAYGHPTSLLSGNDEYTAIADEFNALADRLQETEIARRQFVSDASHELKTPLSAIRLLTDSILQNPQMDEAMLTEFVQDIGQEADRLTKITENLLLLTRLDGGVLEAPSHVSVVPTLARVQRMLSPVAQEKDVQLDFNVSADITVFTTPGELYQILYNLSENAVKYNHIGGCVRITGQSDGETTTLCVADNGIGVPPADLTNIFKRFYRVDKARSRAAGGTGLGLSIVNDTVLRRGGEIWAEPNPDGGTCFFVTLPCRGA